MAAPPRLGIQMLLEAAEFLERREREAEHGYASLWPSGKDGEAPRRRAKARRSGGGGRSTHNEMEKNRLIFEPAGVWDLPQACPAAAVPGEAEGAGASGGGGRAAHHAQPPHQGPAPHPEAGGPGAPCPAPDRAAAAGAAAPAAAAGEAGHGAGQDRQHRLQPLLRALRLGPRRDGRGCGEHGRPPGRPGLEQQQPQRLGRARQPAEPGQRRGLLQLRRAQGQAGRQQEASRGRLGSNSHRRPLGIPSASTATSPAFPARSPRRLPGLPGLRRPALPGPGAPGSVLAITASSGASPGFSPGCHCPVFPISSASARCPSSGAGELRCSGSGPEGEPVLSGVSLRGAGLGALGAQGSASVGASLPDSKPSGTPGQPCLPGAFLAGSEPCPPWAPSARPSRLLESPSHPLGDSFFYLGGSPGPLSTPSAQR